MENLNVENVSGIITCVALICCIFILWNGIKGLKETRRESQKITDELQKRQNQRSKK